MRKCKRNSEKEKEQDRETYQTVYPFTLKQK